MPGEEYVGEGRKENEAKGKAGDEDVEEENAGEVVADNDDPDIDKAEPGGDAAENEAENSSSSEDEGSDEGPFGERSMSKEGDEFMRPSVNESMYGESDDVGTESENEMDDSASSHGERESKFSYDVKEEKKTPRETVGSSQMMSFSSTEVVGEAGDESARREKMKAAFKTDPYVIDLRQKYLEQADLEQPQEGSLLAGQLTEEHIDYFYKTFQQAPDGLMNEEELRTTILTSGQISLTVENFHTLFLRMDTNNDKKVGWDEFLSFVMFEAQEQEMTREVVDLDVPLSGYPRVIKSRHNFPIIRINFMPVVEADRTVSYLKGKYITCSREGLIRYWTLDMYPEGQASVKGITQRKNMSWVTDIVSMPDLHVLCVSSTERDIRFYDVKAVRFDLKVLITRLPETVTCMHYHFPSDPSRDSLLITGDTGGSVRVYCLYTMDINPFYCTDGASYIKIPYRKVLKGGMRNVSVLEFLRIHSEWVKQVGFSSRTRTFVSCATTPENSLLMRGLHKDDLQQRFTGIFGATCFTICEGSHTVVAGTIKGMVLVYDAWLPQKCSAEFPGHKCPIVLVVAQQEGKRIYSMSKDRCIKVWNVPKHLCIQTYNGMPSGHGIRATTPSYHYNHANRALVVALHKLYIILLGPALDTSRSDGYTHTMPVVRALYNPLYKCVATVGMDSFIMVWNLWEGRRTVFIREAHTRNYYGVPIPVEITSAALDPSYQNMVTGARDGSIKVWDFNMGICIRVLNIDLFCEVTALVWVPGRILAVGWDRHVTEFYEECVEGTGKVWETRHTDDVLCMAYRQGQSVATSSYNGELVLWRLETGQAYKRFVVGSPSTRIILTYTSKAVRKSSTSVLQAGTPFAISIHQKEYQSPYAFRKSSLYAGAHPFITSNVKVEQTDIVMSERGASGRPSQTPLIAQREPSRVWPSQVLPSGKELGRQLSLSVKHFSQATLDAIGRRRSSMSAARGDKDEGGPPKEEEIPGRRARRVSYVKVPVAVKPTSATAVLFLQTRKMDPKVGSLLVATDKGIIQVWSHHAFGHCLGGFLAIHMAGDYVTCMDTDEENDYLFTGTSQGFIKIWLMKNFAFPNCDKVRISMPVLRLLFPFLWNDRVEGRAKRSLREQPLPLLLSSYRGHLMAITWIQYIHDYECVMTASADASVRLWARSGRYLGTLGGARPWTSFKENFGRKFAEFKHESQYLIPPDVKQVMSSTTLKVLVEGNVSKVAERSKEDEILVGALPEKVRVRATHGNRATAPVLGHYITVPDDEPTEAPTYVKDYSSGEQVYVYHHLRTAPVTEVEEPRMPQGLSGKEDQKQMWLDRLMASRYVPAHSLPKIDFGVDSAQRVAEWKARTTLKDIRPGHKSFMQPTKASEQRRRTSLSSGSWFKEARAMASSLMARSGRSTISLRKQKTKRGKSAVRFHEQLQRRIVSSSVLSHGPPRPPTPSEILANPMLLVAPMESKISSKISSQSISSIAEERPTLTIDRGPRSSYKGLATKLTISEVRSDLASFLMGKMVGNMDRKSINIIADSLADWMVEAGTKTANQPVADKLSVMSLRGRVANLGVRRPSVESMKDHLTEWLLGPVEKGRREDELQLWKRVENLAAVRRDRGQERPGAGPELGLQQRLRALHRKMDEDAKEARKKSWEKAHGVGERKSVDSWGVLTPHSPLTPEEMEGLERLDSERPSREEDHWPLETHPSKILIHRGRYPGRSSCRLQWSAGRPNWVKMREYKEILKEYVLDKTLPYSQRRDNLPTAKSIKRKKVRQELGSMLWDSVDWEIKKQEDIFKTDGGDKKDKKGKKGKKGKKK